MHLHQFSVASESILALFYLDPGSGSYLLQLLIAGAMGGLLMLRIYWSKVKAFFLRLFGRSVEEDSE